jgi:citrate lyase beta subunit
VVHARDAARHPERGRDRDGRPARHGLGDGHLGSHHGAPRAPHARAAGIAALDGVHLDLDDDAGLAAACLQAADLGFDGKTLIHPKQIAAAIEALARG